MTKRQTVRAVSIEETLNSDLTKPNEALEYLKAASRVKGPDREKLMRRALRDIVRAHEPITARENRAQKVELKNVYRKLRALKGSLKNAPEGLGIDLVASREDRD